jgi:hypothetical protein
MHLWSETLKRPKLLAIVGVVALAAVACKPAVTGTSIGATGFETTDSPSYHTGSIDGQNGWASTGTFDQSISTESAAGTTPDFYGFGDQAWQISDAVNSGTFADQPLTPQTADQSGETNASGASNNGDTAGTTHGFWESSFAFGDAGNPAATQSNLHVTVSPESGSGATAGARMSFISIDDCGKTARPNPNAPDPPPAVYECDGATQGLQVNFQDFQDGTPGAFVIHHVATGLSRTQPHTVRTRIWFFEGSNNDVVQVCVDALPCTVGHSWEDFYRSGGNGPDQTNTSRVDRLLFRLHNGATGEAAQPTHQGNGLFIDNLKLSSENYSGAAFSVSGPTSVTEGTGGTNSAPYTVTLSEPLPFTTTVQYATENGTATAGSDYSSTSATLTFAPGVTSMPISVPIATDATDETNETYSVNLSNPTSTGLAPGAQSFGPYAAIDTGSKTTTIVDDDSTLRIDDRSQNEGNSGTTPMVFHVTLDNAAPATVTVHYQTLDGTATASSDYTATSGTLTFTPGQTSQTVSVPIKGDLTVEPNETFLVKLSGATNSTVGNAQGVGTIVNDD